MFHLIVMLEVWMQFLVNYLRVIIIKIHLFFVWILIRIAVRFILQSYHQSQQYVYKFIFCIWFNDNIYCFSAITFSRNLIVNGDAETGPMDSRVSPMTQVSYVNNSNSVFNTIVGPRYTNSICNKHEYRSQLFIVDML